MYVTMAKHVNIFLHLAILVILAMVTIGSHSIIRADHMHSLRHVLNALLHVSHSLHNGAAYIDLSTNDQSNIDVLQKIRFKRTRDDTRSRKSTTSYYQNSSSERDFNKFVSVSPSKGKGYQLLLIPPEISKPDKVTENLCTVTCKDRCGVITGADTDNAYPCHCDQSCWLYGDCCMDYYPQCLHLHINSTSDMILAATLATLKNYSQVLQFREDFHWSRLSKCSNLTSTEPNFQIVAKCSSDKEILTKFAAVHRDLIYPMTDGTKYFMGLSQDEIKQRCERNVPGDSDQHVLDHTHVTLSRGTAVHFYNVFCAICNGVKPSQVSAWTTNITCDSLAFNQSGPKILFTENFDQAVINNNCTIRNIDEPTSYLRLCFPYNHFASYSIEHSSNGGGFIINEHSPSCCEPSHDLSSTLCERYQNAYMNNRIQKVYKNPHCYLCSVRSQSTNHSNIMNKGLKENWITDLTTMCGINDECDCQRYSHIMALLSHGNSQSAHPDGHLSVNPIESEVPSFRILLDFQSRLTKVTVNETIRTIETKSCPQGQVYVPLLDSCRQVTCMPGTRWLDNQCLSVDACPQMDTEMNETCHSNETQTFDNKYLPFPDGSVYIRLNIALEYIFGLDVTNDSSLHATTSTIQADYTEDVYNTTVTNESKKERVFKMSRGIQIYTQNTGNGECSMFSNSISNLFEVYNLKNMWVEQIRIKNKNATKLHQDAYKKLVTKARQLITETVNDHVGNQSLIVQTIFCSGSTCLSEGVSLLHDDNFIYKRPPNPCLENHRRMSKPNHGACRTDECLSFSIHLRSSANLDVILKAARVMVSDIVTAAHDNNFLVSRLELTNRFEAINDQPTRENDIQTNKGSDDAFFTNSSELCQRGERVIFNDTNVERSHNGTYIVHFYRHQINLGQFSFSADLYVHPMASEGEIDVVNISWCETDMSQLHCESSQMMMFNSPNFLFINGTLVLTKMVETFTQFLRNHSTTNISMSSLDYLVKLFAEKFEGGQTVIVNEGHYIMTRNGVLVCSNFTNTFQEQYEAVRVFTKLMFMPDSEAEIIATYFSLVTSITCLTVTLIVYSVMPSLRNAPGKIVMSLSVALLCAQLLFLCCQRPKGLACEIYAAVHHAAWLASSAWLTAMSVDLAYILNCQSNVHIDPSRSNIFKILSAVCWGVPFLFASICFTLFKTNLVAIGYGQNGVCWFGNLQSLLLVFGVPVFLSIAVTSVCAVAVMKAIGSSVCFRSKSAANRRKSRKQIIVCVNLCLLMGVNWLFYFFAAGVNNTILWTLHILVNGSEGLYIFLCFIARKSLLLRIITKVKLIRSWSRKPKDSRDGPKVNLEMAATATTPLASPCSSVNRKYLIKDQTKQPSP